MSRPTAVRARCTGYPGYSVPGKRTLETAREARVLARVVLAVWGLDDHADTAALILSELTANAARHARGPALRMIVDRPAEDLVYLAVTDRAPDCLPRIRAAALDDVGGRGLLIVDELSARWGYDVLGPESRPWGKRTWAEMRVP